MCGWVELAGAVEADEGMRLKMFLRPGHPQRVSACGSRLWSIWRPGTLAIRAPRTVVKSYGCKDLIRSCSLDGP